MDEAKNQARAGMTPEETELWIELMEKGLDIQHAVLESKEVLDKLPSELRMDGINLLYCRLTRCRAQLLGLVGEEERYRNDV